MNRRVVFLDRDGVLTIPFRKNGKGYAPTSMDEYDVYPDAEESVATLKELGFDVVVVTNQPDLGEGRVSAGVVEAIHRQLTASLAIDRIHMCPHSSADSCKCRKPAPGMLIAEELLGPLDQSASWMVGDRDSDIEAGLAMGCRTIFIDRGWVGETGHRAHFRASSLGQAVGLIVDLMELVLVPGSARADTKH